MNDVSRLFLEMIDAELEKAPADRDLEFIQKCSAAEAELASNPFAFERDSSGTLICPGQPKLCLGSDHWPQFDLCCAECDHYLTCFPEAMPGEEPDEDEEERWLKVCRVRCKICGDVLERTYRSPNDYGGGMMTCTCGRVGFDPGPVLWRVNGNPEHYELLHELAE